MKLVFKKIGKIIAILPVAMARRAFLSCLSLVVLAVGIGVILFCRSGYFVQENNLQGEALEIRINQKVYENVLDQWQKDSQKFKEADSAFYRDIFRKELTEKKN